MSLRIYNTLTRRKEKFSPLIPGKVRMYVCGMTVQDTPHIGHMRAYITSDVIKRWLTYRGLKVRHIQNFTDVDDKVIEKSKLEGIDYREIAERYIEEFMKVADALCIKRADFYPRATEHIQEIVELISKLEERGFAYESKGNVYFDISKFKGYGRLSGKKPEELLSGARVKIDKRKKSPLDFTLWKAAKPGEPWWQTKWGKGRPGWHIECSAMATHYLGESIDIHTGGADLIFPHHENEIAQCEAATGKQFARYWVHNGLLRLTGDKMSKSTGHFIPAIDMVKKYKPDAVRLYLLSTHYRHPVEFSEENLREAEEGFSRITETLEMLNEIGRSKQQFAHTIPEEIKTLKKNFGDAMDDDFNTPKALGEIYSTIKFINTKVDKIKTSHQAPLFRKTLITLLSIVGFLERDESGRGEQLFAPAELLNIIIDVRDKMRKEGIYNLSDELREKLAVLGVSLKDTREGTKWRM